MRAACILLIECFNSPKLRNEIRRSSLVLRHVQHAYSSSRVPIAPRDSSTATARLKPIWRTEILSPSTPNEIARVDTGVKPSSIIEGRNARKLGSADGSLEYWEQKFEDGSEQWGTSMPIEFKGLQLYRQWKSQPILTTRKQYGTTVSQLTSGNAEAGHGRRDQSTIEYNRRERAAEGSKLGFRQDLEPEYAYASASETLPAASSPEKKSQNAGNVGLGLLLTWNESDNTTNMRNNIIHDRKAGPLIESRADLARNIQLRGENTETSFQPSIHADRQIIATNGGESDDYTAMLPSSDSLFAFLRNPKGTRAGTMSKPSKKVSTEDGKAEQRSANKQRVPSFYRVIRAASVHDIEQKLTSTAQHNPNVIGVQFMLKELVEVRHVQPQARHYEALILAHCEARNGSAAALYPILAEMEQEKLGIGASTLSAVLKVLSIHPETHLLSTTLTALASQWITPSISDTVYTILALTRLNQLELAVPHLEHLISTSPRPNNRLETPIPQFLYTTILYRLASPAIADHTAALHLLYLLNDNYLPISNVCMSYLLDSAAEALHIDLVLYIWRSHVTTKYIIPSTGLCRNALLTAARTGNAELAIEAGRVLEVRGYANAKEKGGGVGLQVEELEMIREAFLGGGEADAQENASGERRGRGRGKEKARVKVDIQAVNRLEKRMVELRRGQGKKELARRHLQKERADDKKRKELERVEREAEGLDGEAEDLPNEVEDLPQEVEDLPNETVGEGELDSTRPGEETKDSEDEEDDTESHR